MKTLATAFKEVYGEALKEYGFKKIKGKYPYYVRVIGDEIVHVITFAPRPKVKNGYKEYAVFGGVATLYRHCINLDTSVAYNFTWLKGNLELFDRKNLYMTKAERGDTFEKWYSFSFEENNERTLMESLEYSLSVTKKIMLPILDEVKNLEQCMDFFQMISPSMTSIRVDEQFGQQYCTGEYNEGLLNFLVYDVESFSESEKIGIEESIRYTKHLMQTGLSGYTDEMLENEKNEMYETMLEQVNTFKAIVNNSDEYDRIKKELQRRKEFNLMKLKQYGIEI